MNTKEYNEIKRGLIVAYHALGQAHSTLFQGTQVNQITDIIQSIRVCAYYKDVRLRAAAETLLIYADIVLCLDRTFFWGSLRGMEYRKDLDERAEIGATVWVSMQNVVKQAQENAVYCLQRLDDNNGEGGEA